MAASVEFHTGVADPVGFACRLLRKAYRSGARVLVTCPAAQAARLDRELWTFSAPDFLPHVRLPQAAPDLAARTPIWLAVESPQTDLALPPLLVNLGAAPPDDAQRFERIIEIVAEDEAEREAGRLRWKHYLGWGVEPLHHKPD